MATRTSPKKTATKKPAPKKTVAKKKPVQSEADPRFVPVAAALARVAGFSLMESKSGALRGMMLQGKSFGMSSHRRFILKMSEARAEELVRTGAAIPFSMAGKVTKSGWIEIKSPPATWVELAREALRLASASSKPRVTKKR